MYKLTSLAPILLLVACSRSDQRAGQAAPVGYAQASAATPAPVASAADVPAPPVPAATVGDPEPVAPASVTRVAIPAGTPISVRIDQTVSTQQSRAGDPIRATLIRAVVVGGATVIPAGTTFNGHVTLSDASGRLKGRAHIGVALDSFHVNGRRYAIHTNSVERVSQAHKKRNIGLIGGISGVGAAIGAIAGGGKGALIGAGAGAAAGTGAAAATGKLNVAIPAETPLRFTLRSTVPL